MAISEHALGVAHRTDRPQVSMTRDLSALTEREYDLVIIGGGIYGICTAWDATLRGLSIALLDRGDFCAATSAAPLKIVHGGFRYMQHADLPRIRASINERKILMRIAPHLVYRLPFVIPTYGHGMRGKEILAAALFLYDLIAFDRNRGVKDNEKKIPSGQALSRTECLELFPALETPGLTGGIVFYDGQMYSPSRLALSYLKAAVKRGAHAANYVDVTGFRRRRGRVCGVLARDQLHGSELEIRGKMVLNAGGPWAERLLTLADGRVFQPPLRFSKDVYLIVNRPLTEQYALAVPSKHRDPNAIVSRGQRHLFMIPWRGYTLIGSSHVVYEGDADDFAVTEQDISDLVSEINHCYPGARLKRENVTFVNSGLVPMDENEPGATDLKLAKSHWIIDHEAVDGLAGLASVVGVRYTTSRYVAKKVVDLVFRKLGHRPPKCTTGVTPLYGGELNNFGEFLSHEGWRGPNGVRPDVMRQLLHNHGSAFREVLQYLDRDSELGETIGVSKVLRAEVLHAVHAEMAVKLGDVVFRRTDLGTADDPGESALQECASIMGQELGWGPARVRQEVDEVRSVFP